ncbi:hypothetical protein [Burkholderia sp. BCC0397]|uniref:hypothetical protein n=1 Tax=Burkholderia sp. BCC0397 TaxID=486876 RepID=UPI001FC7C79D|nr:hypothetical protein [Burkholderia sp. BCC0397]
MAALAVALDRYGNVKCATLPLFRPISRIDALGEIVMRAGRGILAIKPNGLRQTRSGSNLPPANDAKPPKRHHDGASEVASKLCLETAFLADRLRFVTSRPKCLRRSRSISCHRDFPSAQINRDLGPRHSRREGLTYRSRAMVARHFGYLEASARDGGFASIVGMILMFCAHETNLLSFDERPCWRLQPLEGQVLFFAEREQGFFLIA